MEAIMISIKPKWVAKILNGEKTIEIRKTMPKCDIPIDVYIYCTKGNDILTDNGEGKYYLPTKDIAKNIKKNKMELNGKVVAKFTLNKMEYFRAMAIGDYEWFKTLSNACLSNDESYKYLGNKMGYAWHIDNLEIFDEPKELSEFYKYTDKKIEWYTGMPKMKVTSSLTKAPQNFCYVEVFTII